MIRGGFFLLTIVAVGVGAFVGCDDEPTNGGPPTGPGDDTTTPLSHYTLVTVIPDLTGHLLSFIDVPADTFMDTVSLGGAISRLNISPDLKRVYASSSSTNETYVYDFDSAAFLPSITGWGTYYFDTTRDRVVRVGSHRISLLQLSNMTELTFYSGNFGESTVDIGSGLLYVAEPFGQSTGALKRYDYATDSWLSSLFLVQGADTMTYVGPMLAVPEQQNLFAYAGTDAGNAVVIADLSTGQISWQRSRRLPIGAFLRSPDGQYVYQSEPDASSALTPGWIWKYQALTGDLIDSISTTGVFSGGSAPIADSSMAATPDNLWLYSSGTATSPNDGKLLKSDLSTGVTSFVPTGLDPRGSVLMIIGPEIP